MYLVFLVKALHIFPDDSLKINAHLDLCRDVRILLVSCWINAGGLLVKVDVSLGFCPNTSWNGEKPCTFAS